MSPLPFWAMNRPPALLLGRIGAVLLIALAAWRVAWVSDDALITLRTALNLTHGWGPGFNATEAVQAYTHPTWFVMWATLGWITNEWVVGIVILSLLFTAGAAAIVAWKSATWPRLILATGALALSNAFVEYATSGLENSLGYLLLGLLVTASLTVVTGDQPRPWIAIAIGFAAALTFLTRMDFAIVMAVPALLIVMRWRHMPKEVLLSIASFALPIILWFTWTYANYAAVLPNTFTAKRNVEIPIGESLVQGLRYVLVSFQQDPVTTIALIAGLVFALAFGPSMVRAWGVGIIAYLGYVVWIGGDFMVGRFLAVPLYVAVLLMVVTPWPAKRSADRAQKVSPVRQVVLSAAAVFIVGFTAWVLGQGPVALTNPQDERWAYEDTYGVADERGFYLSEAQRSLVNITANVGQPFDLPNYIPPVGAEFAKSGLRDIDNLAKQWPTGDQPLRIPSDAAVVCGLTGSWGIVTGPTVHLIDLCGLTDRFLAEQTFVPEGSWRPGHFGRPMPAGYEDAIRQSDPALLADPELSARLTDLWAMIRPQ